MTLSVYERVTVVTVSVNVFALDALIRKEGTIVHDFLIIIVTTIVDLQKAKFISQSKYSYRLNE